MPRHLFIPAGLCYYKKDYDRRFLYDRKDSTGCRLSAGPAARRASGGAGAGQRPGRPCRPAGKPGLYPLFRNPRFCGVHRAGPRRAFCGRAAGGQAGAVHAGPAALLRGPLHGGHRLPRAGDEGAGHRGPHPHQRRRRREPGVLCGRPDDHRGPHQLHGPQSPHRPQRRGSGAPLLRHDLRLHPRSAGAGAQSGRRAGRCRARRRVSGLHGPQLRDPGGNSCFPHFGRGRCGHEHRARGHRRQPLRSAGAGHQPHHQHGRRH